MTPAFFFRGCSFFSQKFLNLAYINHKCINKTETETNNAWYGSSLVTFCNKKQMGFEYTFRQSLINWPFSRGYFGSWYIFVAVAVVERLK